jgi:hypothetical protein
MTCRGNSKIHDVQTDSAKTAVLTDKSNELNMHRKRRKGERVEDTRKVYIL